MSDSSLDHQRFAKGEGLVMGTSVVMARWMASVMKEADADVSAAERNRRGGEVAIWARREVRKSSQLTARKLRDGGETALAGGRLRRLMIGKWSARGGRREGMTLQLMKRSVSHDVCQTLSGRVQLPVLHASRVGMPGGRAIFMP